MLFQDTADNFIGRQDEIALFKQWLTTPTSPWILYFHDALEDEGKKGGVGKTWLLRRCAMLAKQENPATTIVMIDFFNVADRDGVAVAERFVKELRVVYPEWSPTSYTRAMQEYRETTATENVDVPDIKLRLFDALATDLQDLEESLLSKNAYLLVFFDTFEVIEQDPTIAVLHPSRKFPDSYRFDRIRVVMAGRNVLNWSQSNWLEREHEVQDIALSPFSQQEMLQYLELESIYSPSMQHEQTVASALYERTNGRPILLGLVKDVLNQRILSLDDLVVIPSIHFEPYLVAQINNLENPLNWIVLFMAHVYHRFNRTLLEWIMHALDMQDLAPYTDPAKLQATLLKLSFVRYSGYGSDFVLHDEMRRLVKKYCWDVQDPDQVMRREVSHSIIGYYEQEMVHKQSQQERQPSTIELLYHLLFADVTDGFSYFRQTFSRAASLSMNTYARSLLQETRTFWNAMSQEQRGDLTLLEVRLLRSEEKPAIAMELCLELERGDNKQWTANHYADLLFEKGKCYQALDKPSEAITYLIESLDIEKTRGNERRCAAILSSLGFIHRRVGQFDSAVHFYEESILLYKKLGSPHEYANALNNVSNVYRIQGKIEDALQRCKIAWRIRYNLFQRDEIPEFLVGLSLGTMGRIYLDANDILQAESFFHEAFEVYLRTGYRKGEAATYNRFGQLELAKGNLLTAQQWFEKAQVASEEVDVEGYIQSLNMQGRVLLMQKQWQETIPFFTQAIQRAMQIHDHYQHVEGLINLAKARMSLEQDELSLQTFQIAREISLRENYMYLLGQVEEVQGDLRYEASEYGIAFKHYLEYCRYMALYNTLEYSTALRKMIDRLFNIEQNELLSIAYDLRKYWSAYNMDKNYPELISICEEVDNLITF